MKEGASSSVDVVEYTTAMSYDLRLTADRGILIRFYSNPTHFGKDLFKCKKKPIFLKIRIQEVIANAFTFKY